MNIIGISTSGRLNGNTSRIVKVMLDKLSALGARPVRDRSSSDDRNSMPDVFNGTNHDNMLTPSNDADNISNGVKTEFIWAGNKKIEFCRACEHCMKEDACIIKDDYEEIRQKILKADGVILGTPNYAFQMSAQLKAIYDRSHSLLYYTRRLAGKYALGVCVGGHSYMTGKIAKTVAQGIWLCGGYYAGYLAAASVNRDELSLQNEAQMIKKAECLAVKLYSAIQNKKKFRWQNFIRKQFLYPQVARMVENNKSKYPFLYEYYKLKGYLPRT